MVGLIGRVVGAPMVVGAALGRSERLSSAGIVPRGLELVDAVPARRVGPVEALGLASTLDTSTVRT